MLGGESEHSLLCEEEPRVVAAKADAVISETRRERGIQDLGGEQSPWKDRLLHKLATTWRRYGLIGGAKP
jgi:hypothetical protein